MAVQPPDRRKRGRYHAQHDRRLRHLDHELCDDGWSDGRTARRGQDHRRSGVCDRHIFGNHRSDRRQLLLGGQHRRRGQRRQKKRDHPLHGQRAGEYSRNRNFGKLDVRRRGNAENRPRGKSGRGVYRFDRGVLHQGRRRGRERFHQLCRRARGRHGRQRLRFAVQLRAAGQCGRLLAPRHRYGRRFVRRGRRICKVHHPQAQARGAGRTRRRLHLQRQRAKL